MTKTLKKIQNMTDSNPRFKQAHIECGGVTNMHEGSTLP